MGYSSAEVNVLEFDTSGKLLDSSSYGNNASAQGNGGSLQSTPTPKYGDRSLATDRGNNSVVPSSTPQRTLGSSSTWTVQYWYWIPSSGQHDHRITRGTYVDLQLLIGGASGGTTAISFWYNNVNRGPINATLNTGAWNRINLCFSGTTIKLFVNGTQIYTLNTTANCFANATHDSAFYLGNECGVGYAVYGFDGCDRFIMSTTDSAGAEIIPLPDVCFVPNLDCSDFNSLSIGGEI